MRTFPAQYHGHCKPCDDEIKRGEFIVMHPRVGAVHEECAENVGKDPEINDEDFDSSDHGRTPIEVLPRGRTAKDRCDKCFIIHTPGQDGCE
jgi:hypothetical protein